jgi:phosphatidate cytidylyltransferase
VSNFWQRTITGLIFVLVVIGSIFFDYILFAGVFAVITVVGMWEFYVMAARKNIFPLALPGIIAGTLIFFITAISDFQIIIGFHPAKYYALVFLYILVLFIAELFRKSETAIENISVCISCIIYIAIPFSILVSIPAVVVQENSFGKIIIMSFFLLIWTYDIFAYLTGMWLGKHKLFERISPKKTWEGLIGGLIFCIAFAVGLSYFIKELTLVQWIIMAVLIMVSGTFGDLVESMFKRSANCKDSGNIFPGHGGVLDRFDAVLFAAPFVFFYLRFFILS